MLFHLSAQQRQDSIAKVVYTRNEWTNERKRSIEDIARVRPNLTLNEILQMPSKYNISRKDDN